MKGSLFALPTVFLIAGTAHAQSATAGGATASLPNSSDPIDFAHPMFVQAEPGAKCTIHPQGAASPHGVLTGDNVDGHIRFYAPPQSWGSQLQIDCAESSSTRQFAVNLADPTTYQSDTDALNLPAMTAVRAALTGASLALPNEQLLVRGYPPRPDPVKKPKEYQKWMDIVSTPRKILAAPFVLAPGHDAGEYWGRLNYIQDPVDGWPGWSGRAYDAADWTYTPSITNFPVSPNAPTYPYVYYQTIMGMPYTATGCCQAFLWIGMGGLEANAGIGDATLIQSGIYLEQGYAPAIFAEYAGTPGNSNGPYFWYPPIDLGDYLYVWGFASSDSSCDDYSATGNYGCFLYYDTRLGYYIVASDGLPIPIARPSGLNYYGYTFESIVEKEDNSDNIDYDNVEFNDSASDSSGANHDATTDPWLFINGLDESHNLVNVPFDEDGTTDDETYYLVWWNQAY